MGRTQAYDAIVVGAGPNGLAAAILLARAGLAVRVVEAAGTVGGGTRTGALTLPGFRHDICSAIHPLGLASPFFRRLPLEQHGLAWIHPPAAVAHPLDDGTAVLLERSLEVTAAGLGRDAGAYRHLMAPLVRDWDAIAAAVLGPFRLPRHPTALVRFGLAALQPARLLAATVFRGERARGLFAGIAAHSILPLEHPATAAFGLVLGVLGHVAGWPLPRGGSQAIADALAGYLRTLGGEIVVGERVDSLAQLPPSRAVLCDITPRQLLRIAGDKLPPAYQYQLGRYRYGSGAFKIDYALDGPIPWRAAACARSATVHLGGTLPEIAASERAMARGRPAERPFVLLAQQSLFDPTRAPPGHHTAWAYCHVPNGATLDMTAPIEAQIERFAPGFRDRILARTVSTPTDLEQYNANYIGGDINGGRADLLQLFTRPVPRLRPYRTPVPGLYLCSSSTPPGGGVHGMCGYWAARTALRDMFGHQA
jgi:phytoene dehydrogenase-like protein